MTEREAPPDWGFDNRHDDSHEDDGWSGRDVDRAPAPTVTTWTVNGQLRASDSSTLTFRPPLRPWYRTKQATIALIAAAAAAAAVPVVMVVLRNGPAAGPEGSTSVAPQASTGAQPAPSTAAPISTNAPPPPPPPPPEETSSAPADSQPYWTPATPPSEKPDVTPTPVTRAPISVAPVPRQPPQNDLATPGRGRKHWGPW